jgi:hypothetical protein
MTPFERVLLVHEANSSGVLKEKQSLSYLQHFCNTTGYGAKLPVDPAEVIPEREAVRRALADIPVTLRIPLLLSIVGGFSISEIARILQIQEGAVRQRLSRARKAFGQCYAEESGEVVRAAPTDHRKSGKERRPAVTRRVEFVPTPAS